MAKKGKLADVIIKDRAPSKLTNIPDRKFKLTISEPLENRFCFKSLKNSENIKTFQEFIDQTIGKNLTISQVDSLFLRTNGNPVQMIKGREVIHYGKDRKPFRIFGFYNNDGYFTITRIDPKHQTNRT